MVNTLKHNYKGLKRIAFFLILALSLQSCSVVKDLEFKGLENCEVKELSLTSIKLKLGLQVYNPNWFKIKVKGGKVRVKIDQTDLGEFNITEVVTIKRKKEQKVDVLVETKVASIFSSGFASILSLMSKKGNVPVTLDGHINAKALGISKKVNVKETMNLSL